PVAVPMFLLERNELLRAGRTYESTNGHRVYRPRRGTRLNGRASSTSSSSRARRRQLERQPLLRRRLRRMGTLLSTLAVLRLLLRPAAGDLRAAGGGDGPGADVDSNAADHGAVGRL